MIDPLRRGRLACVGAGLAQPPVLAESERRLLPFRVMPMFCKAVLALLLLAVAPALADGAATRAAFWGSPSANGGRCCDSLAEVRENIDRIDHDLVRLLAERQQYVGEAARFKKDPAAVADPKRVDAIIAKVRADAEAQKLDPAVAETTFRAMISAFEDFERGEWTARRSQQGSEAH